LSKRLSDVQKKEIIERFSNGESINLLAEKFSCTKLTISRNIKKSIGSELFNNINNNIKNSEKKNITKEILKGKKSVKENKFAYENYQSLTTNQSFSENQSLDNSTFTELIPLDLDIDNSSRKDCSSIPIDEASFPGIVYMLVDNKTELEIKLLKDYPEWQFLPEEDLQIKTIEIYSDLKNAKRDCRKDQKVIKVPNPNVFKVASKIMLSRGIARIISDRQLISL